MRPSRSRTAPRSTATSRSPGREPVLADELLGGRSNCGDDRGRSRDPGRRSGEERDRLGRVPSAPAASSAPRPVAERRRWSRGVAAGERVGLPEGAVADRFSTATGGGRNRSAGRGDRPAGRRRDDRPRRRATRDRGSSAGPPTVERVSRATEPCSTSTPRTPPASPPSSAEPNGHGPRRRRSNPGSRRADRRTRTPRATGGSTSLRDRRGHRRGRAPRPPARLARADRARRDPRDTDRRLRTPGDGHRLRPAGVPGPVASVGVGSGAPVRRPGGPPGGRRFWRRGSSRR